VRRAAQLFARPHWGRRSMVRFPGLEKHAVCPSPPERPGDVIRLRGKGMPDPHSRRKGDLLVQMQLEVLRKLNERQEELLRELAEN